MKNYVLLTLPMLNQNVIKSYISFGQISWPIFILHKSSPKDQKDINNNKSIIIYILRERIYIVPIILFWLILWERDMSFRASKYK